MNGYLIFRKKQEAFFSIERVFGAVLPHLKERGSFTNFYLPFHSSGLIHVFKNIVSVRRLKADFFHITGDVHYVSLGLHSKKTLLTIHDTVFMQNSKGLKRKALYWLYLKWPVKTCAIITAISEKSKMEIVQYTKCDPGKIVVIPNPVTQCIRYEHKIFNKIKPVILFIGSTSNKNLNRVMDALEGVDCRLRIIGILSQEQVQALNDKKSEYEVAHQLSDEQLADEYAKCDIVLFPSTYEGFGLPILEGQKSGRVVITSNISPMCEIAGQGALLVDPFSVQSIRDGVLKVINDDAYREKIISYGFENVEKYNPNKIADQYMALYKRISLTV